MSAAGMAQVDRTAFAPRLPRREGSATDRYDVKGSCRGWWKRGCNSAGQLLVELAVDDALEGPPAVGAGQVGDLQVAGAERALGSGQRLHRGPQRSTEVHTFAEAFLQALGDGVGVASEHREVVLVDDRAV